MTDEDRVNALLDTKHFTPRQARFVLKVLLHAGVAVQRQYVQFAGIARGEVTRDFFKALVTKRLATAYPCARDKALLYHFHNRTLYDRIGEPNSRFRKRGNIARALERLMILDAVLATPSQQWLATERDKVERFIKRHNIAVADLPRTTFGSGASTTERFFADKFPIGVGALDEITLMYPMLEPTARVFRTFLENHRRLLKRLARWRILLVGSRSLKTAQTAHRRVLADFCAPPLPLKIGDEFRWYCQTRRAFEETGVHPATDTEQARYLRARRAFSAPRFYTFYRRWCVNGDVTLLDLTSSPFYDAARRDGGIVDTLILPHAYAHLAPLAEHKRTSTANAPATPLE